MLPEIWKPGVKLASHHLMQQKTLWSFRALRITACNDKKIRATLSSCHPLCWLGTAVSVWLYSFQNIISTQVRAENICGCSSSKHQSLIAGRLSPFWQKTSHISTLGEILLVVLLMRSGALLFQKPRETGYTVHVVYKKAQPGVLIAQHSRPQRQWPRKILYQLPAVRGEKGNMVYRETEGGNRGMKVGWVEPLW